MTNLPTVTPTIAVAPAQGAQGHATRGGHHHAYMACRRFEASETIKLVSHVNPWRPGTSGHEFYVAALQGGKSATIGAAIELAAKIGLKPRQAIDHLRWLYTWGGSYLEVSGKLYAAPEASTQKPLVSTKAFEKGEAKRAKADAKAKPVKA
jgi:hypothetical protein